MFATCALASACSTQVSQFEAREKVEVTEMGDAPYVGLFLVWGDSPGDRLIQSQPAFWSYLDQIGTALANQNANELYCINFGSASAAYTDWYGTDAFPESYRTLTEPICNFNSQGRRTDPTLQVELQTRLRSKMAQLQPGASAQQFLGSMFRLFEFNDPTATNAPFPKDFLGRYPDVFVVAHLGVTADLTPHETLVPGSTSQYEPVSTIRAPILQTSLAHQLRDFNSSSYISSGAALIPIGSALGGASNQSNCALPSSTSVNEDPQCVCAQLTELVTFTTSIQCFNWIYRPEFDLMTFVDAKERTMRYFRDLTGGSAPKVVMASAGNQSFNGVIPLLGTLSYLLNVNTRLNRFVEYFNENENGTNAICSAHQGLNGQCNWAYGDSGNAVAGIFALAQGLAAQAIRPVILSAPVDISRPVKVFVEGATYASDLSTGEFTVIGNQIVLAQTVVQTIRNQQTLSPRPKVTVTYYPDRRQQ